MPINMTDYRMIINERVYNVLQIMIDFAGPSEEGEPPKPKLIDAVYIEYARILPQSVCKYKMHKAYHKGL